MKKYFVTLSTLALFLAPLVTFAQQPSTQDAEGILVTVFNVLNFAIPVLTILAVVWFIVSVLMYIFQSDDEKKKLARQNMIWGIIGIFVIVAVWGLVNVLQNTFNIGTSAIQAPTADETGFNCPPGFYYDGTSGDCIPN